MAEPAHAITTPARAGSSRHWHNSLPAWIVQEAGYQGLGSSVRQTLQVIANACDPPKPCGDGSLTAAFGSKPLYEAAGCSRPTFWRHVKRLLAHGYVVQLGRGGTIGSATYGNAYGVPGCRGGLDSRRCQPRMMRMVRHDDGKLRPEVIEPGTQATLWGGDQTCEQLASYSQPSIKMRRGGSSHNETTPSQNETPPYPHESPNEKNHGGLTENRQRRPAERQNNNGARRERPQRRRRRSGTHVDTDELSSTEGLLRLFRAYCQAGVVGDSQHERLQFFAMAEHVLAYRDDNGHPAKNPAAMFASNVRKGRWLWCTPSHTGAAQRRLRRYIDGEPQTE